MEKTVKVTPDRLRVLVALHLAAREVSSEFLTKKLFLAEEKVLDALDGLIDARVVVDKNAESFSLTEYGQLLTGALVEAFTFCLGDPEAGPKKLYRFEEQEPVRKRGRRRKTHVV